MSEQLIIIVGPHFCAGAVAANGSIVRAAPKLHYMVGWTRARVEEYCLRKNWWCEDVPPMRPTSVPQREARDDRMTTARAALK